MRSSFVLALAWLVSLPMCLTAQTPLVNINFTEKGGVNTGTFEKELKAFDDSYATVVYDPIKKMYYGCTSQDSRGFYYMNYDIDDALGQAFSEAATWEILFRLDKQQAYSYNSLTDNGSGTSKIFSSQQSGGWSMMNYSNTGLRFDYVTTDGSSTYTTTGRSNVRIETGKFYHVIISVDKSTNKMNIYVNGQHAVQDFAVNNNNFQPPYIGSTRRSKDLWFCLGADPSSTAEPARCENSAQATFVFARIYKGALPEASCQNLYTDEVKYYTQPNKPNMQDMILDAVFQPVGAIDASAYSKDNQRLKEYGHITTRYNEEQKRYEASCLRNPKNFLQYDYSYDPSITAQLGEAYSIEAYCKANTALPDAIICPISAQQSGGFGFEFGINGSIAFNANTYGYHSSGNACAGSKAVISTAANTLNTEYNHYVLVFDRNNCFSRIYINGQLVKSTASNVMSIYDDPAFPFAPCQWIGICGDTKAVRNACDFPFNGEISIARFWGKALSEEDVDHLYQQAVSPGHTVTLSENGIASLCLPFAAVLPEGTKAYYVSSIQDGKAYLTLLAKEGETIGYGVPFILKGNAGTYTLTPADLRQTTLISPSKNLLEGSFATKQLTAGSAYTLSAEGFTPVSQETLPCFNAFLPNTSSTSTTLPVTWVDVQEGVDSVNTTRPDNIKGQVTCSGVGVPGVVVTDGYAVTTTDADGNYSFWSNKRMGYVYISMPSGYRIYTSRYASILDKTFPKFYDALTFPNTVNKVQTHDFKLVVENNDSHVYIVGTDVHLANRNNDYDQYKKWFIPRVKEVVSNAGSTPIYSTMLGDNSWDNYWYSNSFNIANYKSAVCNSGYPTAMFPIMGNHDNDGATLFTDSTDFQAANAYRLAMGPNYYSYNIGKIHYVVLDNIYYINTYNPDKKQNTGITGDRDYSGYITDYQLDWLRKDLSHVSKDATLVIQCHIPMWRVRTSSPFEGYLNFSGNGVNSGIILANIIKDFKQIHVLTGHTHYNAHSYPADMPNLHENNVAAVCAVWWMSANYTGIHNCRDGSPGGFTVYYMNGDSISWKYLSMQDNGNSQFHAVDMNTVKAFYQNNASIRKMITLSGRTNFALAESNTVLVNVFNYDPAWKVEAFENGNALSVTRKYSEDPYHVLTYDLPRYEKSNTDGGDACASKNSHMFSIRCNSADRPIDIKVTDRFGNVYTQTIQRPLPFDLTSIKEENTTTPVGINSPLPAHLANSIKVEGRNICIDSKKDGKAIISTIDGQSRTYSLKAGNNRFSVNKNGIYIIHTSGQSQKVYVR